MDDRKTKMNGRLKAFKEATAKILTCGLFVSLLISGYRSTAQTASRSAPVNLGDLKRQITEYHHSGRYDRDVAAVLMMAEQYVQQRAPMVRKPAVVLDIDETSLSNWPQIQANDYGRILNGPCDLPVGPCGQASWQGRGEDEAIRPTLKLFQKAKAMGVSVFFLTGRSETVRTETEANLRKVGYDGWAAVLMRPAGTSTPSAANYKAPERAKITAQGFTIIANVGDQPSDLAGGYAERTFLVPNPFYRIP
jgi:predicted secreted acid phosphatase